MNISIKIQINKGKLSIKFKKKNSAVKQTALKTISRSNALISDPILSRNLKHLSFIDELELSLTTTEAKHYAFSNELKDIKRLAQVNTLKYLNKTNNDYSMLKSS